MNKVNHLFESLNEEVQSISRLEVELPDQGLTYVSRNSYRVTTTTGVYVAKTFPLWKLRHVRRTVELIDRLSELADPLVIPTVNASPVLSGAHVIYAYPYWRGKSWAKFYAYGNHLDFGKLIGRFSEQLRTSSKKYRASRFTASWVLKAKLVRWVLGYFGKRWQRLSQLIDCSLDIVEQSTLHEPTIDWQNVHGDLHMHNVICDPQSGQTRIVDLDSIIYAPKVWDLAASIGYTCCTSEGLRPEAVQRTIAGFERYTSVSTAERDLLTKLIVWRKLKEVVFLFGRYARGHYSMDRLGMLLQGPAATLSSLLNNYAHLRNLVTSRH